MNRYDGIKKRKTKNDRMLFRNLPKALLVLFGTASNYIPNVQPRYFWITLVRLLFRCLCLSRDIVEFLPVSNPAKTRGPNWVPRRILSKKARM